MQTEQASGESNKWLEWSEWQFDSLKFDKREKSTERNQMSERKGRWIKPRTRTALQSKHIPGQPCVSVCELLNTVMRCETAVKFIRFVFANIAAPNSATPPLPLNYVQPELDMNMKQPATKCRRHVAKHTHTQNMVLHNAQGQQIQESKCMFTFVYIWMIMYVLCFIHLQVAEQWLHTTSSQ